MALRHSGTLGSSTFQQHNAWRAVNAAAAALCRDVVDQQDIPQLTAALTPVLSFVPSDAEVSVAALYDLTGVRGPRRGWLPLGCGPCSMRRVAGCVLPLPLWLSDRCHVHALQAIASGVAGLLRAVQDVNVSVFLMSLNCCWPVLLPAGT